MDLRNWTPIGSALEDDRRAGLADEEHRELQAQHSVAEACARVVIRLRMKLNLSQEQLAKLMGTSPSTIARLEGGRHVPSLATLARVVEAGGMHLVLGFERSSSTGKAGERIVVSV